MTTLIIARHGNTFEAGEIPRRVGLRTDLPLTDAGREQARALGRYLKAHDLLPSAAFCSTLQRTRETATLALTEAGSSTPLQEDGMFNEIDYGPDENKTESEVMDRIGEKAIADWDRHGIVPPDWKADASLIAGGWKIFAERIAAEQPAGKVLVVTSNGVARFAPALLNDAADFYNRYNLKIATGALGIFERSPAGWALREWNIRPT